MNHLILSFDGSCWPNPGGLPKFGWHVDTADGTVVGEGSGCLPDRPPRERTNNTAEFAALRAGLTWLAERGEPIDCLTVRGDSQIILNRMNKARIPHKPSPHPHLDLFVRECRALIERLDVGHVEFTWVRRGANERADALADRGTVPVREPRSEKPTGKLEGFW